MIPYIFAVHIPIAGLSLIPVLFGWPLVLFPVHIVFLELIIDPSCTIAFEAESEEENIMHLPPRKITEPIFSRKLILISLLQGLSALILTLLAFKLSLNAEFSVDKARAFTFTVLITTNISLILTNRTWSQSIIAKIRDKRNNALSLVLLLTATFALFAIYNDKAANIFKFTHLSFIEIILGIIIGSFVALWFELFKKTKLFAQITS